MAISRIQVSCLLKLTYGFLCVRPALMRSFVVGLIWAWHGLNYVQWSPAIAEFLTHSFLLSARGSHSMLSTNIMHPIKVSGAIDGTAMWQPWIAIKSLYRTLGTRQEHNLTPAFMANQNKKGAGEQKAPSILLRVFVQIQKLLSSGSRVYLKARPIRLDANSKLGYD